MRVVSVIETLLHGGAETVLVDLVRGLTRHEHTVVHFSAAHGTTPHPWIVKALDSCSSARSADVRWQEFQNPAGREAILGGFEPDVVIYHWWGQNTLHPWIGAVRNVSPAQRPSFVAVLHRSGVAAPPGFDAYVLVTPSQMPQVAGIDPARVRVIPNGVDLSRFTPVRREPQPDGRLVVGRLSNLRDGKIPVDWIQTANRYGLQNARFVIAGDGPLRSVFEAEIARLGAGDRFSLPGYVPRSDVPGLLATFDVFCYVTSTAVECHPLALLEASAAGVPIVAEARGGIPDIVQHGVNGLLAETPDDIGRFLHVLERDEDLRSELAQGARRIAGQHSLSEQVARYADLLDGLVTRGHAASGAQ
jgi:glycosyltransferase involved in cell wall biosynthesis